MKGTAGRSGFGSGLAYLWRLGGGERPGRGGAGQKALTPLVDTLFLLLFTLLTISETRSSTRSELVRVQLPRVQSADAGPEPAEPARRVVLEIDAASQVRVEGSGEVLRSRSELDAALVRLLQGAVPDEVAIEIRGDREARHGVAVELLQHLRLQGFRQVALLAVGRAGDAFGGGSGDSRSGDSGEEKR